MGAKMKYFLSLFMMFFIALISCSEKQEQVKLTTDSVQQQELIKAEPIEPDSLTRVQQIRTMVKECSNIFKGKKVNCKDGKKTISEEVNEGDPFNFEQTASKCIDVSGYELHTAYFNGHEWSNTVTIYIKDGVPFFGLSETYSEGFATESRFYFKTKGDILSVLIRENDGMGGNLGKNKALTSAQEITDIMANFSIWRKDIDQMVK